MQDQAEFFVGWGTLSLINAGLAQAKGRSGLLWWLGSLLVRLPPSPPTRCVRDKTKASHRLKNPRPVLCRTALITSANSVCLRAISA